MFGDHFMKERLQYGLYGLYPKYRVYVEPLTILLGMAGHALIAATLQNDRGSLSDKCQYFFILFSFNISRHVFITNDNSPL